MLVRKEPTHKQKVLEKEAREMIAQIRRNGFNPPDALVDEAIQTLGPARALVAMRLAALADRKLFSEVH